MFKYKKEVFSNLRILLIKLILAYIKNEKEYFNKYNVKVSYFINEF
ncbi:hypothetical protein T190115A13A_30100 [Tenacibaculum sp. 190524A02b]|uniref:Uncharacterized protein n=1 Tax=Tenacibaculum vairaonense TaxID=3137860 RepID=A0ABM9PNF4_9FLAO